MSDISIGLGIIPAVALVLVAIFSVPDQKASRPRNPTEKPAQIQVEGGHFDEKRDYEAILKFIRTKYKKITEADAETISRGLVDYGKKNKIDPKFAAAVIARESAFNKNAISSTGAKGLGQIKNFNFKSLKINDPYDIKQNVSGTTSYLKRMLSKWKDQSNNVSLALASYYKGYTNVKKGGGKLDKKTSGYVNDILDYYKDLEDLRTTEDRSD